jgi:hypothetical protein
MLLGKPKTANGPSKNDLCALGFLLGDLLFFLRGETRERKIFTPQNKKITRARREPGARRDHEIFLK